MAYIAPEVLDKSYTSQCDLWSMGVVVFVLLSGYFPFQAGDQRELLNLIRKGNYTMYEQEWAPVSIQARHFVQNLLVFAPDKRMTAAEALRHPWIARRTS